MDHKDYLRQLIDDTVKGDNDNAEDVFKKLMVLKTANKMNAPPEPEVEDSDSGE